MAGILFLAIPTLATQKIYVIANTNLDPVNLPVQNIRQLFLDESSFSSNGQTLKPLDLPESSEIRRFFYLRIANRTPAQMKSYWARMVFTGKGTPPLTLSTEEAVEQVVALEADKIGYVSKAPSNPKLKVLTEISTSEKAP